MVLFLKRDSGLLRTAGHIKNMFFYLSFFFIFGLIMGSFGNVCIYRIPREQSLWKPRSRCPSCGRTIQWYDNIPLLSFLLLKRACRACGHPISWQYPLVELITGIAFLLVAWRFAFEPFLPVYLLFTFLLIILSGIDYFHLVIPDVFPLIIVLIGLGTSAFDPSRGDAWFTRIGSSLLGALTGGGLLYLTGVIGSKAFHKEAMGGGDIKLMAGVGALLGWQQALATIFLGSLIGSIYGITLIATRRMERRGYIPFGPFLALGAYLTLLFRIKFFH